MGQLEQQVQQLERALEEEQTLTSEKDKKLKLFLQLQIDESTKYDDLNTQNEDKKGIIERLSGVKYSDFHFADQGAVVIQGGGARGSKAPKPGDLDDSELQATIAAKDKEIKRL